MRRSAVALLARVHGHGSGVTAHSEPLGVATAFHPTTPPGTCTGEAGST
jgi:hypothetical protein